jgi:hypothetical protein
MDTPPTVGSRKKQKKDDIKHENDSLKVLFLHNYQTQDKEENTTKILRHVFENFKRNKLPISTNTEWFSRVSKGIPLIENCAPYGSEENQRLMIKQQAIRLLLLRHGSKCKHKAENRCPRTIYCWTMQMIFDHLSTGCVDSDCSVPHCIGSTYVIRHYICCKLQTCGVCIPTRSAVKANYERSLGGSASTCCDLKL